MALSLWCRIVVNTVLLKRIMKLEDCDDVILQEILQHVKALVYVDTDVLLLRPLEDIWKFFSEFSESQIASLAPEHEEPTASWYWRFARHPYVPPYGKQQPAVVLLEVKSL